jgi:hypothetical protein
MISKRNTAKCLKCNASVIADELETHSYFIPTDVLAFDGKVWFSDRTGRCEEVSDETLQWLIRRRLDSSETRILFIV